MIEASAASGADLAANSCFANWLGQRQIASLGTNAGSDPLPFQNWVRFKEAFAPELVALAIAHTRRPVSHCIDPFGGSGTTALTCQFLGIASTTVEVNPFLADLIASKLHRYDSSALVRSYGAVLAAQARSTATAEHLFAGLPATFVEPGLRGRWIFDRRAADEIAALVDALNVLSDEPSRRLLRVLLGGLLLRVSNVTVSGKGRRYRRNWATRTRGESIAPLFASAVKGAFADIHRFRDRASPTATVSVEDSRVKADFQEFDLAAFSPPYPNSFDYTDVYNVELWMLGYISSADENRALRNGTFSSHVQLYRAFRPSPSESRSLNRTLHELDDRVGRLWSPWIPAMIGGYFADMVLLLRNLRCRARPGAECWIVVGESMYADVRVETGRIISELAPSSGWEPTRVDALRSLRASAQHGGRRQLAEDLVVLVAG
jgi:hypothetical protein